MADTARLVSAEELAAFPDDEYRYELAAGHVVRMTPVGFRHGRIVMRLGALLMRHAGAAGVVVTEVGFKLSSHPDTVRAPDLAYVRQGRIPSPDPQGFWDGPPDLAIEVLSPDDQARDMHVKVREYLARGVRIVMTVDPGAAEVAVFRPSSHAERRRASDVLDLGEVIAGCRFSVSEIFE